MLKYESYKSLFDKLNASLPYGSVYNATVVGAVLYLAGLVLSVLAREQGIFFYDYVSVALIFGISFMVYMETYIGNSYREVAGQLFDAFGYDSSKGFQSIFNNLLRTGAGILVSAIATWIFLQVLYGALWYTSPILRAYFAVLVAVISFIGGEALVGVLMTVRYVREMLKGVSPNVDIFKSKHLTLLKSVVRWGSDLSAFGGIVASVLLVAFFFAPWRNGFAVVSGVAVVFLMVSVGILVFVFTQILVNVHSVMKSSKEEEMGRVMGGLDALHSRLEALIGTENLSGGKKEAEVASLNAELDGLDKVRSLVDSLPVMPLDLGMVRTFSSAIAIPIVTYAADAVLKSFLH